MNISQIQIVDSTLEPDADFVQSLVTGLDVRHPRAEIPAVRVCGGLDLRPWVP